MTEASLLTPHYQSKPQNLALPPKSSLVLSGFRQRQISSPENVSQFVFQFVFLSLSGSLRADKSLTGLYD